MGSLYRIENQMHGGSYVIASSMETAIEAWRDHLRNEELVFRSGDKPDDWEGKWPGLPTDFSGEEPDSIRMIDKDGVISGS